MPTMLWALGSMVVLMLIITFLPLGYSLKGKILVGFASFLLSLGGLAAAATFPLWQTALMLFALTFFAAYFMNNRMASLIFNDSQYFEEVIEDQIHGGEFVQEIETQDDIEVVELDDALPISNTPTIPLEKVFENELDSTPIIPDSEETTENGFNLIDEDILFLQVDNTNDEITIIMEEDLDQENGYLSEIESLLEIETVKLTAVEDDLLAGIEAVNTDEIDEKLEVEIDKDEDFLDDSLFDFLNASQEAAADTEDTLEVIEPKKQLSLQK